MASSSPSPQANRSQVEADRTERENDVDDHDHDGDEVSSLSSTSSGVASSSNWSHKSIRHDRAKNRSIPIWIIAFLWVALLANWAFVLFWLMRSDRPISSPPGPVPKWQKEKQQQLQQQQQNTSSLLLSADEPAPPLIDSMWLYAALPALYMPTLVVFCYVNWVGWQFFKHN